jgi:lysophospholipase L1-like esterase
MVLNMISKENPGWFRWRTIIDLALVVTLIFALLAWFFDPWQMTWAGMRLRVSWGVKPWLAIAALMIARSWINQNAASAPNRLLLPRIALSIGITLLALLTLETALGWLGVPRGEGVFVVQGQSGPAIRADGSMVSDSDLLWRFQPGMVFNGRSVNQLGYLDREISPVKSDGVIRVVCMGDSCSAQGIPPYSGHLNSLLNNDATHNKQWDAFNTAVHGYTVLQGLALYRTRVAALRPDIVTVFFGWNDHWLAEEPDAARFARVGSPLSTAVRNAIAQKRITVALLKFRSKNQTNAKVLRVPPEEYETGLTALVGEIRDSGALPVLITAPRAENISRRIVHAGHTRSVEEANELHDAYAEITRRVARETGAHLFDLAALLTEPTYFSDDGIHYTDEGIRRIAELLHNEIMNVIQSEKPSGF